MAVDDQGNEIIETVQPTVQAQPDSRAQERIKQLSEKVELTSKERDEFKSLNETANREVAFYKGYADIVSTQPNAKDHQDEIKEKVLKGYSVQDATFAVLGAAGKLGTSAPTQQVAGGSAATAMPQGGAKEVKDMNQTERRSQLEKDLVWQ